MEWTPERVAQLRTLWAEGVPVVAIGQRMGISKNAIVGKAHRLHLTARQSPIKAVRERQAAGVVRRVTGPTLPPLAALGVEEVPAQASAPVVPVAVVRIARTAQPCCWPIGEPGTKAFRFCEAAGEPGRSYCAAHCAVAYVQLQPRSPAELAADEMRRRRKMEIGRQRAAPGLSWAAR